MATIHLKETDPRYNIRQDAKELASSYRLSVQPRKRSVNLVKRAHNQKNKGGEGGGGEIGGGGDGGDNSNENSDPVEKPPESSPEEESEDHVTTTSATAAMYLQTTSWGKMDDIIDEEYQFDHEEDEDDTPEPKEEPHCQKKYRQVCQMLRCRPIKHFLRSLVTDTVAMKNYKLSRDEIKACVISLLHADSVETVWFDSNGLGLHGATKITDIIPRKNELTELRITNNRLCSEGARIICESLKHNAHVRRLDLSGNEFNEDDAVLFKDFLDVNLALRALNLSHNNFRERGGVILGAGLATNRTLQKLDLGWNHLRMSGAVAIGKSLKDNCDLEELSLAWNGFHLRGCIALGESLAVNNSLTLLDITCNRVSELSLAQLLKGLKANTTLEKLLLPMNPLSPHAAYKVLTFIDENDSLALDLVDLGTTCVYEEFETFLEELKTRRDIEVIRGPLLRTGLQFVDPLASDGDDLENDNPLVVLMEYCRLQNLRLVDMFKSLDTDGSKSLSYAEFKEGMHKVGIPMSDDSVDRLMEMLDRDGDGEIDFAELSQGQKEYKELIRQAIQLEGSLDASAIGRVGMRMKEKCNQRFMMRKF